MQASVLSLSLSALRRTRARSVAAGPRVSSVRARSLHGIALPMRCGGQWSAASGACCSSHRRRCCVVCMTSRSLSTSTSSDEAQGESEGKADGEEQGEVGEEAEEEAEAEAEAPSEVGKVVPINIYKDGADPVLMEDSEYPEWLFTLLDRQEGIAELEARKETLTWNNGGRKLFKLKNRMGIRRANEESSSF